MASSLFTKTMYATPFADAATENRSPAMDPGGGGSPFVALRRTSDTSHPIAS